MIYYFNNNIIIIKQNEIDEECDLLKTPKVHKYTSKYNVSLIHN